MGRILPYFPAVKNVPRFLNIQGGVVLVVLFLAGACVYLFWDMTHPRVDLVVINRTPEWVRDAAILAGGRTVIAVGDLAPGQRFTKHMRLEGDYGPIHFRAALPRRRVGGYVGCLLTDDGPFAYTITIGPQGAHLDGYEGDDGAYARELEEPP